MKRIVEVLQSLLTVVIGRVQWQPPDWIPVAGQFLAAPWRFLFADRRRIAVALLALLSAVGGFIWYKTRPIPRYVEYKLTAPELTKYDDNGIATIKPVSIQFSE